MDNLTSELKVLPRVLEGLLGQSQHLQIYEMEGGIEC